MNDLNNSGNTDKLVEVRCFGSLKKYAEEKGWTFPYLYQMEDECTATELARRIGLPIKEIEGVFINGIAQPIHKGLVKPGERVGFIPYGIPGPYRIMLGFKKE